MAQVRGPPSGRSYSASTLAKELPISRQAIARHLEVPARVGPVEGQRRGREVVHSPVGARLSELGRDLRRIGSVWEQRLAGIKKIAEEN